MLFRSLIDTEDIGTIQSKINECVEKDSGALEEKEIVIAINENKKALDINSSEEKIESEA